VVAKFNRADGVNVGTDVRLSGIKVGTVEKNVAGPEDLQRRADACSREFRPAAAGLLVRITSEGLLGNQYLSIEPGSEPEKIKPGGEIENTQGSIDLIGLLGKAVFSAGDNK
jgi:phospholipid/cholesterol/gamma-HCH transport system substrate-binding protein